MKKYAVYYESLVQIGEQVIHVLATDKEHATQICFQDGVAFINNNRVYPTKIHKVVEL